MARQFVCVFCKPPDEVTGAGHRFFAHHKENLGYIGFVAALAKRSDEVGRLVEQAITQLQPLPDGGAEEGQKAAKRGAQAALASFQRLELEFELSRSADNFLCYLSDLLGSVFLARPETLKSSETVRVEEILQHSTMNDLVRTLATRKVERLSYQGMKTLAEELETKMGFQLFGCEHDLARAVRIVESRNLLVHNRGIVNEIFLSRTELPYRIGQHLPLDHKSVGKDTDILASMVFDIDKRAAAKWSLPLQAFAIRCEHWEQYLGRGLAEQEQVAAPNGNGGMLGAGEN
jgi:hypothetical protein